MVLHDNVGPKLIGKLPARFIESLAEPLTRPVSPEKWIVTIAGKCEFAWLPRFVETDATFLQVSLAGLRIDYAHPGQDSLRFRRLQENYVLSRHQHALRSTSGRATPPTRP